MNILVIGSGAREHTLIWKLAQSSKADRLYAVPGNPGMAQLAECIEGVSITDNDALVKLAQDKQVGLVVVGPEVPLTNGAVDAFTKAGIKAFGPVQAAAEIEGSKSFSKNLMKKYHIPTAKYEVFTEAEAAKEYIRAEGAPIVIKADGLAAGKGVIVAMTLEEALAAIDEIMGANAFGNAGSRVVVEEFMAGEEVSVLCFTDGRTILPMVPSQDHKRVFDDDQGPNTGGMGAYAPAPVGTPELLAQVQKEVLDPVIKAMEQEGRLYKGCLYAGLMVTDKGPKVVEFNARFGDPETQVVLPLLESDLVDVMLACIDGSLAETEVKWSSGAAVCIVMAAGGYPKAYDKGDEITGLTAAEEDGSMVFHAGTSSSEGRIYTNGGRVLGVVSKADGIQEAVDRAYAGVAKISFRGAHYRHDIAHWALERLKK
ncbi:MAG: phosphoribosylamine--glycine ligase [Anaerovibrio sp.]|nr:phosphoribosylamine--glycine ligase [Anaerovibrio sp.]